MTTDTRRIPVIEGEIEERCALCDIRIWATPVPPVWLDDEKVHLVCAEAEMLNRTRPPYRPTEYLGDCRTMAAATSLAVALAT